MNVRDYQCASAVLYQILGAYDAPDEVMDLVNNMASGDKFENPEKLLPFVTNDPSLASLEFALSLGRHECYDFLELWNEGGFDICRREWPEAPKECYIGADPLFKD